MPCNKNLLDLTHCITSHTLCCNEMHSSELHTICKSYCQIKLQDAPLYEDIDAIENTGDNGDFIFHTDNDDDCVDNLIIHANSDDD